MNSNPTVAEDWAELVRSWQRVAVSYQQQAHGWQHRAIVAEAELAKIAAARHTVPPVAEISVQAINGTEAVSALLRTADRIRAERWSAGR